MTKVIRIFTGLLLLVLLAAAGLWLAADRLLDGVVRPWLTAQAALALEAEVRLERLTYAEGWLHLNGLTLARPGELQLEVKAIDVQFAWLDLLQRRLGELVIRQPRLVWIASVPAAETEAKPAAWPPDAPLQIEAWRVEDGRAELQWGRRQFLLKDLRAEGGLGRQFPLTMTARCGTVPGIALRLVGSARWQQGLALTLSELSWDQQNLLTQPVLLAPGPDLNLGLQLGLVKLDSVEAATLLGSLGQPVPWPETLQWQVLEPKLGLSLQPGGLQISLQSAGGSVETAGWRWPWQSLAVQLQGDQERLNIDARVGLAGFTRLALLGTWADQQLTGAWDLVVANPAALLQAVNPAMPSLPVMPGKLVMHGRIEAGREVVRLTDGRLSATLGELGSLNVDLRGEWRGERLLLVCPQLSLLAKGGNKRLAEATLTLAGSPGDAAWQGDWSLRVADATRLAKLGGLGLPVAAPELHDLSLSGDLRWRDGHLRLSGIDLAGQLTGAGVSARLQGRFDLLTAAGLDLAVMLESLRLVELDYQAEDGMAGLIGGNLVLGGRLELAGERVGFDLTGQAGAGEALLQSWYASLADLPARFTLQGSWLRDPQRLDLTGASFDLAGLLSGRLRGAYSPAASSLSGQVEIPRLDGAFLQTLQALAGELVPGLDRLSLAGQLVIDGAARRQEQGWSLDLAVAPKDVSLAWGETLRLAGLRGRLPVHLRQGSQAADAPAETASLQWGRLQAGLLDSVNGRLELLASANRWRLLQPLTLAAAGGAVRLTTLQLDLPELVPQLRASLEVADIELLQVSRQLGWPEMGGLLSARLEEIQIAADEISTVGGASMRAFGGEFAVRNMRVEAPFSRFPTYHADVDFSGLDLYQLTNTFAFGEMNGVADGYIHGLRLFDGVPSALTARLETRPEGVRNISVKAIRNLNTLSQGGLSAALSHGIYRFIDFYRYRKIGIVCSLQNDLFRLAGTGRDDSDQYLIYGGLLPPRIDVLVSSPTISFKEMMRRLKRIERAER